MVLAHGLVGSLDDLDRRHRVAPVDQQHLFARDRAGEVGQLVPKRSDLVVAGIDLGVNDDQTTTNQKIPKSIKSLQLNIKTQPQRITGKIRESAKTDSY